MSQIELAPMLDEIQQFENSGKKLNAAVQQALFSGKVDAKLASEVNAGMMQVERNWLNPDGIPGRPWFKHTLYGARFTYAHLELPGLTEAVEKKDWNTAKQQATVLRGCLEKNTKLVDELTQRISPR